MVCADPSFYIFLSAVLLILPPPWIASAVLAAVFHEFCHLAAVSLMGGRVEQIRLGVGGAVIEAHLPGRGRSVLAALAGPSGSLLLMLLCHSLPRIALCGLIQGIYNLLPFHTLDGGRVLKMLVEAFCPEQAERIMAAVEITAAVLALPAALYANRTFSLGFRPGILVCLCLWEIFRRKIPCKGRHFRVQ